MQTRYILNVFLFQCNNPLTKEAKLTAAKRIVPEWTDYDNEIKSLWDSVSKSFTSSQSHSTSQNTGNKNMCNRLFMLPNHYT